MWHLIGIFSGGTYIAIACAINASVCCFLTDVQQEQWDMYVCVLFVYVFLMVLMFLACLEKGMIFLSCLLCLIGMFSDGTYIAIGCSINVSVCCFLTDVQ